MPFSLQCPGFFVVALLLLVLPSHSCSPLSKHDVLFGRPSRTTGSHRSIRALVIGRVENGYSSDMPDYVLRPKGWATYHMDMSVFQPIKDPSVIKIKYAYCVSDAQPDFSNSGGPTTSCPLTE